MAFLSPLNAPLPPDQLNWGHEPVLLTGLHADVDAALAHAGLLPRPAGMAVHGSAQVWTLARGASAQVAVISVTDAAAMRALARNTGTSGRGSGDRFGMK